MHDAPRRAVRALHLLGAALVLALPATPSAAQEPLAGVLTRSGDTGPEGALQVDRGAVGAWQTLLRARTTASVLYTTGHPDDEESGVLTLLGRGMGVRTGLLTLNRGEGGANAIGPELFDALGLIRTEELRLAGRYYGLDDQYFTTAVDYGYSKTLDEAMRSWDRERVLGDMVRVIRTNRPLVVISRWHGSERDGHGHHQAAGVLTPEAVEAAADPTRFPEQISHEGLRPWRVRRVYRGRLLDDEPHDLTLDPYRPSPWLGASYQAFGAYGLSLQRSQTAGRRRGVAPTGPPARYERLYPEREPTFAGPRDGAPTEGPGSDAVASGENPREHPLFAGLDVSLAGVGRLTGEAIPEAAASALAEAEEHVERAIADFDLAYPAAIVPDLIAALQRVRSAIVGLTGQPDAAFLLAIEERRLSDALLAAAGIEVSAQAVLPGEPAGSAMGPAVPGQGMDVHVTVSRSAVAASLVHVALRSSGRWIPGAGDGANAGVDLAAREIATGDLDEGATTTLTVTVPSDAAPTRPWFHRADIRMNHYEVLDSSSIGLGESAPDLEAVTTLAFPSRANGNAGRTSVQVTVSVPVHTVEVDAPRGSLLRPLTVVPPVTVRTTPGVLVARPADRRFGVSVEVGSGGREPVEGTISLRLPAGWRSDPASRDVTFSGAGQTRAVEFDVIAPDTREHDEPIRIRAVARVAGREYGDGYRVIDHRDLQPQRLYGEATLNIAFVDAQLEPGLNVGYVMGVGDDVPQAIEQLGASVTLLGETDLAAGELGGFDAIVVGTRAYAVRPDLVTANARLLDYARRGGSLVVLYQTPEYQPETQAPFPASLPGNAEEVSEEDAPVRILAPEHPLLTTPNRITTDDFDGWVEQRGSKFFASWAPEYTPLVESHDTGQAPQEGIWVTAAVGEGRFTYVALALQRQVPYGVEGAYRILANLLSRGR